MGSCSILGTGERIWIKFLVQYLYNSFRLLSYSEHWNMSQYLLFAFQTYLLFCNYFISISLWLCLSSCTYIYTHTHTHFSSTPSVRWGWRHSQAFLDSHADLRLGIFFIWFLFCSGLTIFGGGRAGVDFCWLAGLGCFCLVFSFGSLSFFCLVTWKQREFWAQPYGSVLSQTDRHTAC